MSKTMESLAGAVTGCFQMTSAMFEGQMQQQHQQTIHYGFHQPMPTNICMNQQSTQQLPANNVNFVQNIRQNFNTNYHQEK